MTDSGGIAGINLNDLQKNIATIREMAVDLNASLVDIDVVKVSDKDFLSAAQLQISIASSSVTYPDRKVLFIGSHAVGKSTLIGALLLEQQTDDGRGRLRTAMMKHRHEILTGTTSSLTCHELASEGGSILRLFDTAGLPRFVQRSSLMGMTIGNGPDAICLILSPEVCAVQDVFAYAARWEQIALFLRIELILVFNKSDVFPYVDDLFYKRGFIISCVTRSGVTELANRLHRVKASSLNYSGIIVEHVYRFPKDDNSVIFAGTLGLEENTWNTANDSFFLQPGGEKICIVSVHRQRVS